MRDPGAAGSMIDRAEHEQDDVEACTRRRSRKIRQQQLAKAADRAVANAAAYGAAEPSGKIGKLAVELTGK